MIDDLATLVTCESPSADPEALSRSADAVAELGTRLTGVKPTRIDLDERPHLRWRFGTGDRVLVLGHHDTVWPIGSLADHPWRVTDGRAYGPGCFDMKAGIVQTFHALSTMPSLDGVTVLITADEELGAPTSRELIRDTARQVSAVLVPEGSADGGALKTARKGVSIYDLRVRGRAAHAGLEPWNGVNATVELAHQIRAIAALGDDGRGHDATTVTPTMIAGGTSGNTVPAEASVHIDVRSATVAAQARVHDAIHALSPRLAGAVLRVDDGPVHPPLEPAMSAELYAEAEDVAAHLGIGPLGEAQVGGASDGNIAAGAGVATLDGLGAVGGKPHAPGEHVIVDELPKRAHLLAKLIERLIR